MNTKILMTLSSVLLALAGIGLTFAPAEIAHELGSEQGVTIVFQILGASYFGLAMINWTARANLIGGIYNRPVAIGNFSHFAIGAMALVKVAGSEHNAATITMAIIYGALAVAFGYVLFTHPKAARQ